jgi:AcrR family transcriptional regulator
MQDTSRQMNKPRARNKQSQIIGAAQRLFMDQGFGGTSMDAIAEAAAVSKATLYAYFASKEDLFTHVVTQAGQTRVKALDVPEGDVGESLRQSAHEIANLILSPDNVAMYRIIMSEGRNFPDLGARFYTAGPAVLIDRLAAHLAAAMQSGVLRQASPRMAAAQFIGMILGDLQLRVLLHVGKPPGKRAREEAAEQGVDAFLRGYRP